MGTALYIALVHCNVFSNYSFTVLRSALLRETMMGTHLYFPSSNGAERSAFDNDGNIAISLAIQYFPAPLRSVGTVNVAMILVRSGAERGNIEWLEKFQCSHHCQKHSAPLRWNCERSNDSGTERSGAGKY